MTANTKNLCGALAALLLSSFLVADVATAQEDARSSWLPFAGDETTAEAPAEGGPALQAAATDTATDNGEEKDWMVTSPLGKIGWPEMKMPKLEFNPPWRKEPGEEGWFSKARTGAKNAMTRTRTAWNDSIDKMKLALPGGDTPGETETTLVASKPDERSFWQRMIGPPPAEQPDDVVELMARERGDIQR